MCCHVRVSQFLRRLWEIIEDVHLITGNINGCYGYRLILSCVCCCDQKILSQILLQMQVLIMKLLRPWETINNFAEISRYVHRYLTSQEIITGVHAIASNNHQLQKIASDVAAISGNHNKFGCDWKIWPSMSWLRSQEIISELAEGVLMY